MQSLTTIKPPSTHPLRTTINHVRQETMRGKGGRVEEMGREGYLSASEKAGLYM
jgi:hypothetical protein